ncbi:LysR family transcriptional regulator [Achromobacter spanius]|uniref:helix-turn-helix domain-containing protein n=1 Tax=Achromobacter spanius TaxID=217203 RepID=UPI0037F93941
MAQPVVTRKIRRLEEHLGLELSVRSNRGCELTAAGAHCWCRSSLNLRFGSLTLEPLRQQEALSMRVSGAFSKFDKEMGTLHALVRCRRRPAIWFIKVGFPATKVHSSWNHGRKVH